jgi:cholesterol transport system auxiliary component
VSRRIRNGIHRLAASACAALLLAGCINLEVGGKGGRTNLAHFDLAGGQAASPGSSTPRAIALRSVDVVAPTWLDGPAMQYRLAYADPARRASFAESRWVAPPPELLQQTLRRQLSAAESRGAPGACRLQIEVDEFVQVFDSPQSSSGVIELRAALLARSDAPLARQTFRASRPAQSADARGGVAALAAATGDLATAIGNWLDAPGSDSAIGVANAARCRAN